MTVNRYSKGQILYESAGVYFAGSFQGKKNVTCDCSYCWNCEKLEQSVVFSTLFGVSELEFFSQLQGFQLSHRVEKRRRGYYRSGHYWSWYGFLSEVYSNFLAVRSLCSELPCINDHVDCTEQAWASIDVPTFEHLTCSKKLNISIWPCF